MVSGHGKPLFVSRGVAHVPNRFFAPSGSLKEMSREDEHRWLSSVDTPPYPPSRIIEGKE